MKKYIKKLLIPILFVLLVIIFLPQKLFVTHAQTQEFDETFFSKANTYDAIITKEMIQTDTDFITYDSIRYDTYSRNSNQVSDEDPQVTFITHGLNGKASHWSNVNEVLTPTKNSIIDILTQMTDCNIYLAVFTNWNFFELFQLEDDNYSFMDKEPLDNNKILDNSKHSIVLFQAFYPDQTNDFIYTQFNILVSSILLDLQELDPENELPRINLIGHSRGGITNLQYALDHPQIVDSIFSLGTPYLGSTMASIDNYILGGIFTGNSAGEDDITNPDIYLEYLNRWNRDYELLYSDINVHAIGAYSSLDTLLYQLIYYIFFDYLKINDPKLELEIQVLLKAANLYLSRKLIALKIVDKLSPTLKQELASGILNIVFRKHPEILLQTGILQGLISILNLIFDELNFNVFALSYDFLNDFLVDLPSQLGYDGQSTNEYKGFKQHKKRFSILSNFDLSKTSVNHVPVLHNLETRDTGLLLYIAKNIRLSGNLKGTPYITSIIDEESVAITGYVGKNVEGQLAIPEVVYREDGDGNPNNNLKKVVEIGDNAFSDNMQGSNTITSVVIPKTVKRIGKNAFYNNEYLQSISFSQNSELEIIEEGAFSYIPQVTSFTIPSFVHQIGERAFEGSGISSMIGNNNYIWNSNLLIQQNVSDPSNLIALYANPNAQSITIPENVKILSAYLFKNNQNLTSINLNQTQYIGYEAFNNSSLTTITNSNNVKEAGIDAFIGTKWLDNQTSNFITLGKVLIECKTNQQQLIIPEGIVSIGENCMVENTATSIILPSTLEVIGQSAFLFNSNLQWVLLNSTNPPILSDNSFGEDVIFYVKGIALNTYQNNIYYQDLPNQIKTKEVNIDFYNQNNDLIGSSVEEYYSSFDKTISAPQIEGYDFVCWEDENGNKVYVNDIFNYYNDVNFTAYYEPSKYTMILNDGSNNHTITITYGETVNLGVPQKDGYRFIGWYDQEINGTKITGSDGIVTWTITEKIECLYARFVPIEYEIEYETNQGEFFESEPIYFDAENPITTNDIPELKRFGYVFDGWMYEESEFETTYGIYEDIILEANWIGTQIPYTTSTITSEVAIIDLSGIIKRGAYNYTIASNVKSVTFIGLEEKQYEMRIIVSIRSNPLIIGLENMHFAPTGGYGYDAISSKGTGEIYLYYKGTNSIQGGSGANGTNYYTQYSQATGNKNGIDGSKGGNGQNGGYGIRANKVHLVAYDEDSSIVITGGNGGTGGRGGDGQYGSNGQNPPSGSFLKPVKGDNGAKGGNGGQGGNGGNGVIATNAENVYGIGGKGGASGYGGNAGIGGKGGDAGDSGSDGDDGKSGNNGAKGKLGLSGQSGYNTEGNENSIRVYPYLFTKSFFLYN